MVYPFGKPTDPCRSSSTFPGSRAQAAVEHRPDESADRNDLQRLESSIQWLKREGTIARTEAGPRALKDRRLPRAGQLAPISGIRPVDTEGSGHKRETLTFHVAPPLASERIEVPAPSRQHRYNLRGVLGILIGSVIVGLIAYQISVGGLFAASGPAQAAYLKAED
jgi:hypothetical protein